MQNLTKTLIAAAALTVASGAFAQGSTTTVNVDNVTQKSTAGLAGKTNQKLDIGNASNGGKSNVQAKNITQSTNAGIGAKSNQTMSVGNAANGGKSNVVVKDITQKYLPISAAAPRKA